MTAVFEKYFDLLWNMFQFDINVLSQPWMYYWLLLPAVGYLVFFFIKWVVLTTPVWLPSALALHLFVERDESEDVLFQYKLMRLKN
jgi:hypothetical protein